GNDEIGVLVDGFNGMLEEIGKRGKEAERAHEELRRRVRELDAEVAERRRAQAELQRSREHLQSFVENANVGMHWVAPDGTILWANRHEVQMLGYALEEYVGQRVEQFHLDPAVIAGMLARLVRGESIDGEEARLRHKDGSTRRALITASGCWEEGRLLYSRFFTRDITARTEAEERLRESEARYRTLVAATTSGVFATDATGRVHERLPSWEAYTGQPWDAYAGSGWAAMVHRADRRELRRAWVRALRAGEMFEAE